MNSSEILQFLNAMHNSEWLLDGVYWWYKYHWACYTRFLQGLYMNYEELDNVGEVECAIRFDGM